MVPVPLELAKQVIVPNICIKNKEIFHYYAQNSLLCAIIIQ